MSGAPVIWPPALARLRHTWALEEVASTMRHTAVNDLAAVAALVFRMRRHLETTGALAGNEEIANALQALDARIAGSPAKLAVRFAPPARRPARAELGAAARELIAALAPPLPVQLEGAEGAETWAAIDGAELQIAIGCLIENAVEAAQAAGRGAITLRCTGDASAAVAEVTDDAETLTPERAEHLLDPFFSSRPGHAGLGLKIARAIAQRWEGELVLAPVEPRGFSARIELPKAP